MRRSREHADAPARLLSGLVPPCPPAGLRARCLEAARRAAVAQPGASAPQAAQGPDLWSRLWESRPLRLAWAATVTGLIVANGVLSLPRWTAPVSTESPFLVAAASREPELAAVIDLPAMPPWCLPYPERGDLIGGAQPSISDPTRRGRNQ